MRVNYSFLLSSPEETARRVSWRVWAKLKCLIPRNWRRIWINRARRCWISLCSSESIHSSTRFSSPPLMSLSTTSTSKPTSGLVLLFSSFLTYSHFIFSSISLIHHCRVARMLKDLSSLSRGEFIDNAVSSLAIFCMHWCIRMLQDRSSFSFSDSGTHSRGFSLL